MWSLSTCAEGLKNHKCIKSALSHDLYFARVGVAISRFILILEYHYLINELCQIRKVMVILLWHKHGESKSGSNAGLATYKVHGFEYIFLKYS